MDDKPGHVRPQVRVGLPPQRGRDTGNGPTVALDTEKQDGLSEERTTQKRNPPRSAKVLTFRSRPMLAFAPSMLRMV
jgi:hypothetical protein